MEMRPNALSLTRSHPNADDLLQETALKALTHSNQFLNVHPTYTTNQLKAWLYAIMRNAWYSLKRGDSIHRRIHLQYFAPTELQIHVRCRGETYVELAQTIAKIQTMPKIHQDLLGLLAIGASYEEIGKQQGVPLGTVKSRMFRAYERLQ